MKLFFKKIFLFIKKYWFIIATISSILLFLLIKIFNTVDKDEINQKVETIKKENDEVIKHVNEEIKEIDKKVEQIKKDREEIIKRKKERDKKANDIFNVRD